VKRRVDGGRLRRKRKITRKKKVSRVGLKVIGEIFSDVGITGAAVLTERVSI
tara:strand:- start:287 stop:442 length:156 start_codon:yes stop_codon:yes gene_type:complete